ncbi:hypothetical protein M3P05_00020 [Sansalvadorimonas sp. 2012CJ34-2]|uniref:Uncharacterized protein n=1 Tax=Parendozoicomonas callyspongiae TaxID=2942213 RepID=A0ABT0PAV4_9GAMM|nr:hypothetical protein [Sansalvadorimonas sp. 2012CJ34-2]MCL6268336.1 hypothetical protein [Sansalvadorimonas sp. 2012CJ34-2]
MNNKKNAYHDFISIEDSAQFLGITEKSLEAILGSKQINAYVILSEEMGQRLIGLIKDQGYSVERLPAPFDIYWQLDPQITRNVILKSLQVFEPNPSYTHDSVSIHRVDLMCNVEELAALQSSKLKLTAAATKEIESWAGLVGVLIPELVSHLGDPKTTGQLTTQIFPSLQIILLMKFHGEYQT